MRHRTICQVLLVLSIFLWATAPALSTPWPEEDACAFAVPVSLNNNVWMEGIASMKSELFAMDVGAPGILGLEATASGSDENEPFLFFLGTTCTTIDRNHPAPGKAASFVHIDHSARSHMVEVREPGTYFVRVVAADPLRELGNYRLNNRFVERAPDWAEGLNESEDEEIDIDEWDEDILSLETRIPTFCSGDREGGAGELSWCATSLALGELARGKLSNPWNGFAYYTFTLDRPEILSIEIASSTDTFWTLYDLSGNRLAAFGDGGDNAIIKVLPPGRYTLRAESLFGSEGAYYLLVRPEVDLIE